MAIMTTWLWDTRPAESPKRNFVRASRTIHTLAGLSRLKSDLETLFIQLNAVTVVFPFHQDMDSDKFQTRRRNLPSQGRMGTRETM